jgi:hypothetical protein
MTLQTRLDGNVIQSGSIPVTAITNFTEALTVALPVGTISGSAQVVNALPTDTVSSSAQVTAFLPANTVSSSGQIQLDAITGTTFATTDFTFPQAVTASNVLITGTATVRELKTLFVTSSVIFESGSTKFGDSNDDTHQLTGSLELQGDFYQNGILVTLTSQDYGLITGIVDNFADYGSIV